MRRQILRCRGAFTLAVVLATGLAIPTLASATSSTPRAPVADAPNTCVGATASSRLSAWVPGALEPAGDVDWYRFTTTSSRWSVITLGGLPANYRLDLYAACGGAPLASSDRPGVQYEELYRNVPAGAHFVRVSAVAGAHSPAVYQLRFRPLGEAVVVLSNRSWIDAGRFFIVGALVNNTGQTRELAKAILTFYNAANQPIGSSWVTYSHIDLMKPRTRSSYGPAYANIPAGYHHARVTAGQGYPTSDVPVGNLTVKAGTPFTAYGYRHYPGTLTNRNAFALSSTSVVVTLYGSLGGVVNADVTYPGAVGAGKAVSFEILLSDHYTGVNRYVFQAEGTR